MNERSNIALLYNVNGCKLGVLNIAYSKILRKEWFLCESNNELTQKQ